MEDFRVDTGSVYNLDLLVGHWLSMWGELHPEGKDRVEAGREISRKWMIKKLGSKELIAFIVNNSARVTAGSGYILIREDKLRLSTPQLFYPYILSMYTLPEFRNRGVGSMILEAMIQWSKDHG